MNDDDINDIANQFAEYLCKNWPRLSKLDASVRLGLVTDAVKGAINATLAGCPPEPSKR